MTETTRNTTLVLLFACLCLSFWAVSTAGAYLDLRRRGLPPTERVAWIVLVAGLPGLGLAAYLLSRLLGTVFSPPGGKSGTGGRERVTLLKNPGGADERTGTIPAAELLQPTRPDPPDRSQRPFSPTGADIRIALDVLEGPHSGEQFQLETLPASIGREPGSEVQLEQDRRVSRLQAEIYRKGDAVRIRDLRSTHGTFINGYSIDDKALEAGDRIEVGASLLLVREV
jgi:hypothetical protein